MPPAIPAPLWLRIAAAVYDLFPLIGLWMLTAGLAMVLVHGEVDVAHPSPLYRNVLRASLLAVTAGYFVLSWVRGGQTIGMRAWGLRVVSADGTPLQWPRASLRFALALCSLAACGFGYLWCVVDRQRRGWHDIGSRSMVVRLGA
ncbi:MAG TPA: RDD family protein [Dokdonella sp.]|nr:RDD family protein [Dokdonella sp.]